VLIAEPPPTDRYYPVPPTTMAVTHERVKLNQGGQRVKVTIPATPGTNEFGDSFVYRWQTGAGGGARCQPGPLPNLTNVTAGSVIDAPLPKPAKGWCRGLYGVTLEAVVTFNCAIDPPLDCGQGEPRTQDVARVTFRAGSDPTTICHRHGEAQRCWTAATYRDPASWSVSATLDDLLGPDGATSDADPYFERAFRKHPLMDRHWEIDDNEFYGFPTSRKEAIAMAKIVDRVLHSGPFHGKTWPGRD
jgi:hypothetical protein